jgi:long-subunit fatty acid transport protein
VNEDGVQHSTRGDVLAAIQFFVSSIPCIMHKHLLAFFLPILFLTADVSAQESPLSKWTVQLSQGMGTAVLQNDLVPSRLEMTGVEVLGGYRFNDQTTLATGVSLMGLNGNSFNELGNYNQTRGVLRVPVILQNSRPLSDKAQLVTSAGVLANHILEDSRQYVGGAELLKVPNLSIGLRAGLGVSYDLTSRTALGLEYQLHHASSDLLQSPETLDSRMSARSLNVTLKFRLN